VGHGQRGITFPEARKPTITYKIDFAICKSTVASKSAGIETNNKQPIVVLIAASSKYQDHQK
jgi:hypothetical protein